jgi:hypothetical protein
MPKRKSKVCCWDMSCLPPVKRVKMFSGLEKVSTEKVKYSSSLAKRRPPQHSSKRAGT